MRPLVKATIAVLANLLGLWVADYFLANMSFGGPVTGILLVALALTVLNWILKPVLKLFFGPVIILTLGLALIVVNVLILFAVDFFFQNLSIHGVATLVYASLIISLTNLLVHAFVRK